MQGWYCNSEDKSNSNNVKNSKDHWKGFVSFFRQNFDGVIATRLLKC